MKKQPMHLRQAPGPLSVSHKTGRATVRWAGHPSLNPVYSSGHPRNALMIPQLQAERPRQHARRPLVHRPRRAGPVHPHRRGPRARGRPHRDRRRRPLRREAAQRLVRERDGRTASARPGWQRGAFQSAYHGLSKARGGRPPRDWVRTMSSSGKIDSSALGFPLDPWYKEFGFPL